LRVLLGENAQRKLIVDKLGLLELAIYCRKPEIVDLLLRLGADPNLSCMYAFKSKSNSQEPLQLSFEPGPGGWLSLKQNLKSKSSVGADPILHFAIRESSIKHVDYIVENFLLYGFDLSVCDVDGLHAWELVEQMARTTENDPSNGRVYLDLAGKMSGKGLEQGITNPSLEITRRNLEKIAGGQRKTMDHVYEGPSRSKPRRRSSSIGSRRSSRSSLHSIDEAAESIEAEPIRDNTSYLFELDSLASFIHE